MADHHFVPQFYLRGFRDPWSLGAMPKDQWLWVADRARGEVKARAPRNVGARTNYNALPEAQGHESAEQVLSRKLPHVVDSSTVDFPGPRRCPCESPGSPRARSSAS